MLLTHWSPRYNRESIQRQGLRVCYSQSRSKSLWFHAEFMREWAAEHVAMKHGVQEEELDMWTVEVPGHRVRKHGPGIFLVSDDVPPEKIVRFDMAWAERTDWV